MTARRILTLLLFLAMASVSAWGAITSGAPTSPVVIGQSYSFQFTADAPATWTVSSGALPPGLTLSSSGLLSGQQLTQVGTFGFEVTATPTDPAQGSVSQGYTIVVNNGPPVIDKSTFNLKAAVGTAYSDQLGVLGGKAPYSWLLAPGNNDGISISASTGLLSGTPVSSGSVSLNVQVSDSNGGFGSAVLQLNVIGIDTTTLPAGAIGTAYSQTLQASGAIAPLSWSLTGNTPLPPGLGLSTAGVISGTPTTNGTYPFSVTVIDSTANSVTKGLTIVIGSSFTVTTTTLPNATVGSSYSQTLQASGGTAPLAWSATGLPATLSLSSAGVLSGTPAATGTISFTATVTDATNATATANLSLTVIAAPFRITTTSPLPGATLGIAYSQVMQATGGTLPLVWSAPGLPAGLTIAPATGTISGTPTTAGSTTFSLTVTDANSVTATGTFTIVVTAPSLTVTGPPAGCFVATMGRRFPDPQIASPPTLTCPTSYQFTVTGGTAPYIFAVAVAGTLPPGLTLSSAGVLSGTPTAAGSYTFVAIATDSLQAQGALSATVVVGTVGLPTSVNITLGGSVGPNIGAALQPAVVLSLGTTFPFPVNGTLTVSFASSVGGINSLVTFSNGTPTTTFRIAANTNIATISNGNVLTGTQAGTITLSATSFTDDFNNDMTPRPPATVSYTVAAAAPAFITGKPPVVITSASAAGMTVAVTGYSTARDMVSAVFHFTPTSTTNLGAGVGVATDVTVQLGSAFSAWYSDARSNPFGSTFVVTIPFTFSSTGASTVAPIAALTVTLTNSKGASTTSGSVSP